MSELKNNVAINTVTSEVVNNITKLFKESVYKIILYGSYARGDFNNESDVDIMILLDCDKERIKSYRKRITKLASRISLENDVEVSLLIRDKETFEQEKEVMPFYKNVVNEGVSLYG